MSEISDDYYRLAIPRKLTNIEALNLPQGVHNLDARFNFTTISGNISQIHEQLDVFFEPILNGWDVTDTFIRNLKKHIHDHHPEMNQPIHHTGTYANPFWVNRLFMRMVGDLRLSGAKSDDNRTYKLYMSYASRYISKFNWQQQNEMSSYHMRRYCEYVLIQEAIEIQYLTIPDYARYYIPRVIQRASESRDEAEVVVDSIV